MILEYWLNVKRGMSQMNQEGHRQGIQPYRGNHRLPKALRGKPGLLVLHNPAGGFSINGLLTSEALRCMLISSRRPRQTGNLAGATVEKYLGKGVTIMGRAAQQVGTCRNGGLIWNSDACRDGLRFKWLLQGQEVRL